MSVYATTLKKREIVAKETLAIWLRKPEGFQFSPGQFVALRLPGEVSLVPGRGRYEFSIASVPEDTEILLVMRLRPSPFKQHLASLPLGSEVDIEGPLGTMVVPKEEKRRLILLAGGIGIAPFRSMILTAVSDTVANPITLFYSNPTREHAVFFEEFAQIASTVPSFQFVPVITRLDTEETQWSGETGYFTTDPFGRYLKRPVDAVYYIVGPVRMVIASKRQLRAYGAPEEHIHMEIFTGY